MPFLIKVVMWIFVASVVADAFTKINKKLDKLNITVDQIKTQTQLSK